MKKIRDFLRAIMLLYKRILCKLAFITTSVDDKAVVFESFQGRSYSCNPRAIFLQMLGDEKYKDYKLTWSLRDDNKTIDGAKIVKYESFGYYRALGRSKYWIFNSNIRPFLKPKKDQIFLETWHGTPFKKIGMDVSISKVNYMEEAKKFTYMISPSSYCSDRLVSAFGLDKLGKEDIILETGYARNDELFNRVNEAAAIKNKLGIPSDKKVMLYAPTFRDNKHSEVSGYSNADGIDFAKLKQQIGEEYVVLFRAHYFVAQKMNVSEYMGFVYDVSSYENVNDLYIASDLLVTDYSSVFFDYANLKRPIYFFMYDADEYQANARDFYISVDELPGPIAKTQDELVDMIGKGNAQWQDKYEKFNAKFNYLDDGECAKRVIEKIGL